MQGKVSASAAGSQDTPDLLPVVRPLLPLKIHMPHQRGCQKTESSEFQLLRFQM